METTYPEYFIPTFDWITNLQVGDLAPDCFGKARRVVEVVFRGADVNGREFVHYYTDFGGGSRISCSQKEGQLHRSTQIGNRHTSHELDRIEREMGQAA